MGDNDTAGSRPGIPTREDTDRLAAGLPADRTDWKGDPLDEVGKRFYGLRESGYTGWINEDGYPTTGPTFMHTDEDADGL